MGFYLAQNMAVGGIDLTVYDLRTEATDPLRAKGAVVAESVEGLAASCDVVAFCVLDERQVENLVDQLITLMAPGKLLVMHSTISPGLTIELAERAAAHGIGFVDAPVSGGMDARIAGTLTVFAGGTEADFARARPMLELIGSPVVLLGPVGSGSAGKVCNNLMQFCNSMAAFEGMRLAAAFGIDEASMVRLSSVSSGSSWTLKEWGFYDDYFEEHTLRDDDQKLFDYFAKDLELAVASAELRSVDIPFATAAAGLVRGAFRQRRDLARSRRTAR